MQHHYDVHDNTVHHKQDGNNGNACEMPDYLPCGVLEEAMSTGNV